MKLTAIACQNARPNPEKAYNMPDGEGLYLIVKKNGIKQWRLGYRRPSDGKTDTLILGLYPDVSLSQARAKKSEARALLNQNKDPKRQYKISRGKSFEAVARHWFENWAKGVSDGHAKRSWRYLETYIFPYIGHRHIETINPLEMLELIQAIEKQGKHPTAQKTLDTTSLVFRHGGIMGLCHHNATNGLASMLARHEEKHYPHLIDPLEIGQLLLDIDAYQGSPTVRGFMQLLPLVLTRPSETRFLKWAEIDIKNCTFTKEATKNNLPHIVPLSSQAMAIIEAMMVFNGDNDYVFASSHKDEPISDGAPLKAMKLLSAGKAVLHGWRHTASTLLNEQGFNYDWIEKQLAHKDKNSIRGTYNHAKYLDQRRDMLQTWADYLDELKAKAREI